MCRPLLRTKLLPGLVLANGLIQRVVEGALHVVCLARRVTLGRTMREDGGMVQQSGLPIHRSGYERDTQTHRMLHLQ